MCDHHPLRLLSFFAPNTLLFLFELEERELNGLFIQNLSELDLEACVVPILPLYHVAPYLACP